jgi:hypothetical protein
MFWGWYNPNINKFEYDLKSERVWYNMLGEEIRWGFTISDLQVEDQTNLTLEETLLEFKIFLTRNFGKNKTHFG